MTTPVTGLFKGAWTTGTVYNPGDVVIYQGAEHTVAVAHTSTGTFDASKHVAAQVQTDLTGGGNIALSQVGKSFRVKEGSNACMGTATLNGTTAVVVSTTAVTATSRIFLTIQSPGGTPASPYVSARTAGTSFSIKSTGASDTSTVAWLIFEPA